MPVPKLDYLGITEVLYEYQNAALLERSVLDWTYYTKNTRNTHLYLIFNCKNQ